MDKSQAHPQWLDLDHAPGHLIRRAQQLHQLLWSTHVSTTFTSVQFAALNALAGAGTLDQVTLAARIHADPATTTELVHRMSQQGYLLRTRSTTDGRRKEISLTDQGRAEFERLVPLVQALQPLIEAGFTSEEREQLRDLLNKLLRGRQ